MVGGHSNHFRINYILLAFKIFVNLKNLFQLVKIRLMKKIIAHIDMDAFFASIEEVSTPGFLGKPIVVGAEPKEGKARGVVSTANYLAREYGIHSALPISKAFKLAKKAKREGRAEVIFLPVDFKLYQKVSKEVYDIIKKYSPLVEQASIDEFYFDLSHEKTFQKAQKVCLKIKEEIKKKRKITASIGIAPNKLISKIAADYNKPNGLTIVQKHEIIKFLNPLKVKELPGVGPKTNQFLNKQGIFLIKELKKISKKELEKMLGKNGLHLYQFARGEDNRSIEEKREIKSISEQVTFEKNTLEASFVLDSFFLLSENVFKTFLKSNFTSFKRITITIRFSDFETKTSSQSFRESISKKEKKRFKFEVLKLVLPFLDRRSNPCKKEIRLIGVRLEKFVVLTKNKSVL